VDDNTLLLAIDTSSEQSGIALFDGDCLDEVAWSMCHEQTVLLLDEIDHQLSRSRATIQDIGAVAVAIGPGRFNALRVGMSIAKGLVLALEIPIIGVSTLDAIAHPFRLGVMPVVSVIQAGRGRVVWRAYDLPGPSPALESVQNSSIEDMCGQLGSISGSVCVAGEIPAALLVRLHQMPDIIVPARSARLGRAAAVAELARTRWSAGDVDDPATLEPVYVHSRRPVAAGESR
jgi:tRNA threonylcarbamoyladenosine biosynthesis protein TsaB